MADKARGSRCRYGEQVGHGGAIVTYNGSNQFVPQVGGVLPPRMNPPHSNITKRYNNWNACYSCGFDVDNWHHSNTCNNRKTSHNKSYTRLNAQEFINHGPRMCTKGIHKTLLPQQGLRFRRGGAGESAYTQLMCSVLAAKHNDQP